METIKTITVSVFVYGWIYGEQFYCFMIRRKEKYEYHEISKCSQCLTLR